MLEQLDPLNFSVVRIEGLLADIKISTATAFFYRLLIDEKPNYWLVTSWHVLSGRHTSNLQALDVNGSIPNRIRLQLHSTRDAQGREFPSQVFMHERFIDLYDAENHAIWFQHQLRNEVDVAVIHLGQASFWNFTFTGVNAVANNRYDMAIGIGDEIFVLGYPLGFTYFIETPIWKRGSIASEPHTETDWTRGRILIDATTRKGMSGSPVILRAKTHYLSESGEIKQHPNASRFLGVYSSRPVFEKASSIMPAGLEDESDRRAELGYVYKSGLIDQIIQSGIRGPRYGELP
jgi:Trypsin-like peptidase domain